MLYVTSILKDQIGNWGIPPMGIKSEPENPQLRVYFIISLKFERN